MEVQPVPACETVESARGKESTGLGLDETTRRHIRPGVSCDLIVCKFKGAGMDAVAPSIELDNPVAKAVGQRRGIPHDGPS